MSRPPEKVLVKDRIEFITADALDGGINSAIALLNHMMQEGERKGYRDIRLVEDSGPSGCYGYEVIGLRLENDTEYNKRCRQLAKEKVEKKTAKQKAEQREKEQLTKLLKKYPELSVKSNK